MSDNFFNVKSIISVSQNPFSEDVILTKDSKRLNGYDSAMLNSEEKSIQLEYKIAEKEKELTSINGQISHANMYGTQSEILSLKSKKARLEKELYNLKRQQAELNWALKNRENSQFNWFKRARHSFEKNFLSKISKKFNSFAFLGDSLDELATINQNVGELITKNVPYGEKQANYDKLTQYLSQANKIHSQISKKIAK